MRKLKKAIIGVLASAMLMGAMTGCGKAASDDITVISREDGSGTRGAFIELFGIEEKDADGNKIDNTISTADITNSTSVMMTSVADDEAAIGYISLGSLDDSVKALKIDGAEATADNISNGSYKVSRPFNIATKGTPNEVTQDFINFILSEDGQKVVEDAGYISQGNAGAFKAAGVKGKINIAGSSSVTPVMEKLKEAYVAVNPDVQIEVQQSDSTTGMTSAAEGVCDIGMASRELKDSELSAGLTPTVIAIDKDDSENVELERFGEPVVPDFEVPYHTDIMEKLNGIDLDSARKVAGNGFYYLMGDIARLHSAVISYARDFMIDRGFTYCVPPFMIRSNVVTGVMSFAEMDAMMYKIEGEDLYLIGTSEHSMIGKFIDTMTPEEELPKTLTSYSPCFRKEKGAHGIEERGVYRIHQFEKQEMIVVCKPEDSKMWFDKLWKNTVDLFRSMDIPVRTIECCSGDLADLKVKSYDVEAWSPRQKKYFEVGSCSNLGDAQARRLGIKVKGKDGKYFAHTLNNTVVAPPRMLIAFLENNLNEDGSINIPKVLQPYMGGKTKIC